MKNERVISTRRLEAEKVTRARPCRHLTRAELNGYSMDTLRIRLMANNYECNRSERKSRNEEGQRGETQKANCRRICIISTFHTKHRSKIANASRCRENCNEVLKHFPMQKTVFPNDRQAHALDIFRETYVYEKFLFEPRG